MARLTDAQLRNQRAQALRALRRKQREMDTYIERVERKLDRAIENKERITIRLALGLADDYKAVAKLTLEYQHSTADMLSIFLQ